MRGQIGEAEGLRLCERACVFQNMRIIEAMDGFREVQGFFHTLYFAPFCAHKTFAFPSLHSSILS